MTLRQKTLSGLKWSFIDSFASQGIHFVIGIILARLLVPKEDFGLMGMLAIFIALSQSVIDSGFSQALIRKQNCRQVDFNTVFYFNLLVGIVFYALLYFGAGLIAGFFNEPQLKPLARILGLILVINSLGLIQRTIITKEIDFKLKTKISLVASLLSGGVSIGMALNGFGVWSLAGRLIAHQFAATVLFWLWNKWRPTQAVSIRAFKEMFGFGSRLLASGLSMRPTRISIPSSSANISPSPIWAIFSRRTISAKFLLKTCTGSSAGSAIRPYRPFRMKQPSSNRLTRS